MTADPSAPASDGLVIVDKPAGWTSHDVVARVRRLAGTRRVGHAGTLDPMATGVLVVGVGRATRMLGHLADQDKSYEATIRLGASTTTDDAEGEITRRADSSAVAEISDGAISAAVSRLTGPIAQVPSAVSAIKVGGRRAYAMVRAGQTVDLPARQVTVHRFDVLARRGADLDVAVDCSAGTYIRALARDLGAALGVGGHLVALRRTRVGGYDLSAARTLDQLAGAFSALPLAPAARAAFPARELSDDEATDLSHGRPLSPTGRPGPVAAMAPDGALVALVEDRGSVARPLVVFAPAGG